MLSRSASWRTSENFWAAPAGGHPPWIPPDQCGFRACGIQRRWGCRGGGCDLPPRSPEVRRISETQVTSLDSDSDAWAVRPVRQDSTAWAAPRRRCRPPTLDAVFGCPKMAKHVRAEVADMGMTTEMQGILTISTAGPGQVPSRVQRDRDPVPSREICPFEFLLLRPHSNGRSP